ncbi:MAG: bifunctional glutamate N-acetyltransferase/amino-acid acetyltransferase ArgJ [Candidatus Acidiferrales bacterium]|jgi:glutamate N-acetyltransferase/amino-acid N-acetyltransferase
MKRVALPRGFRFAAAACGLKKSGALDLGLLTSDVLAPAAAVFTRNRLVAAPLTVSREHLRASGGRMRAVLVNSKNANCATGAAGLRASKKTAEETARLVGCAACEVFVNSTGVIGVPLPVEKIVRALPGLVRSQRPSAAAFSQFARAIMTTDLVPKWASAAFRIGGKTVRIAGCAKGSGMIHPNMATMLAFIAADAAVAPAVLQRALSEVVGRTFNSISVDGDTSTNDTVLLLANGASGSEAIRVGSKAYRAFLVALESVCRSLALQIVADGEGAQRVIEIEVRGARTESDARRISETIATSSLVKTAFAGGDPNWGRILAAAGRAGVPIDPSRATIIMAGVPVFRAGRPLDFDERTASKKLLVKHVPVVLDLRGGRASFRYWTCDFTAEYVRINSSYRT